MKLPIRQRAADMIEQDLTSIIDGYEKRMYDAMDDIEDPAWLVFNCAEYSLRKLITDLRAPTIEERMEALELTGGAIK